MFGILLFIGGFFFIFYLLRRRKEEPVDFSKTSEDYAREYPDLTGFPEDPSQPEEQPNIVINITHNHLHVYPTPEENQPR